VCGEGEVCLTGRCHPYDPCTDSAECEDEDPCTFDSCVQDNCVRQLACDDGDPCTTDECTGEGNHFECSNVARDGQPCDDYNPCTIGDVCSGGDCQHGVGNDCEDGNPCSVDYCSSDGSCVHDHLECDDRNECTVDYCDVENEGCVHEQRVCGPGKRCAEPLGWCVRDITCTKDEDCPAEDTCWPGQCSRITSGEMKCGPAPFCEEDEDPCIKHYCETGSDGSPQCLEDVKSSDHGCDDSDPCTEADHCLDGYCLPGDPVHCDDGDPCTTDSCDRANGGCVFDPVVCPEGEVCLKHGCVTAEPCEPEEPEVCDDGDACTSDNCEENNCFHHPACEDGDMCTVDTCSPAADGSPNCSYSPMEPGAPCEDGDHCTIGDSCEGLNCVPGAPADCDDGDACSMDYCHPHSGCQHDWIRCDDFNPCTQDHCDTEQGCAYPREVDSGCSEDGYCANPSDRTALDDLERALPSTGIKTEAGRICAFRCSERSGRDPIDCVVECVRELSFAHGGASGATLSEPCESCLIGFGRCVHEACNVVCRLVPDADRGLCAECLGQAACDEALDQCAGLPVGIGGDCESLSDCPGDDSTCIETECDAGYCRSRPKDCDDFNPCTRDECSPAGNCENETLAACGFETDCANGADDDGDALDDCFDPDCEKDEACLTSCDKDDGCDDANLCTTDLCLQGRCVFDPMPVNEWPCGGDMCNAPGVCRLGFCVEQGDPRHCDDGNPCTEDRCDVLAGCVFEPDDSEVCDDGDACTWGDRCFGGRCTPGGDEVCEDGSACTHDSCDSQHGCVHEDACAMGQLCVDGACFAEEPCAGNTDCDDEDICTQDERSGGGNCKHTPVCDAGNPCTFDLCSPGPVGPSCVNDPAQANDLPCGDDDPCTAEDRCRAGECEPGTAYVCDDGNACSEDLCVPFEGCFRNSTDCDDGNACTVDLCLADKGGCFNRPVECPEDLGCDPSTGECTPR
jgi:hypothetical protein